MNKFFISIGTVSCDNDEKTYVLSGARVKRGLDHYVYMPVIEQSFRNRQKMIDKLTEIANKMWDEIEGYDMETKDEEDM